MSFVLFFMISRPPRTKRTDQHVPYTTLFRAESQVPVQVLTREDIDRSGFTSVADIMQNLTASGAALNTKFNSSGNFGFPPDGGGVGAGAATVDLDRKSTRLNSSH